MQTFKVRRRLVTYETFLITAETAEEAERLSDGAATFETKITEDEVISVEVARMDAVED